MQYKSKQYDNYLPGSNKKCYINNKIDEISSLKSLKIGSFSPSQEKIV